MKNLFLGVTGASGAAYALDFLDAAAALPEPPAVTLAFSRMGEAVFARETGRDPAALGYPNVARADDADLFHPMASGTNAPDVAVVCPLSSDGAAKLVAGIQDTLILRVAANMLKMRRTLLLVPRETPASTFLLRNLLALSEAGATVVPASPPFYHAPRGIPDLLAAVTGYLLDLSGLPRRPDTRWIP